jgi:hypothetical protein
MPARWPLASPSIGSTDRRAVATSRRYGERRFFARFSLVRRPERNGWREPPPRGPSALWLRGAAMEGRGAVTCGGCRGGSPLAAAQAGRWGGAAWGWPLPRAARRVNRRDPPSWHCRSRRSSVRRLGKAGLDVAGVAGSEQTFIWRQFAAPQYPGTGHSGSRLTGPARHQGPQDLSSGRRLVGARGHRSLLRVKVVR